MRIISPYRYSDVAGVLSTCMPHPSLAGAKAFEQFSALSPEVPVATANNATRKHWGSSDAHNVYSILLVDGTSPERYGVKRVAPMEGRHTGAVYQFDPRSLAVDAEHSAADLIDADQEKYGHEGLIDVLMRINGDQDTFLYDFHGNYNLSLKHILPADSNSLFGASNKRLQHGFSVRIALSHNMPAAMRGTPGSFAIVHINRFEVLFTPFAVVADQVDRVESENGSDDQEFIDLDQEQRQQLQHDQSLQFIVSDAFSDNGVAAAVAAADSGVRVNMYGDEDSGCIYDYFTGYKYNKVDLEDGMFDFNNDIITELDPSVQDAKQPYMPGLFDEYEVVGLVKWVVDNERTEVGFKRPHVDTSYEAVTLGELLSVYQCFVGAWPARAD